MSFVKFLIWQTYFIIYVLFISRNLQDFFSPSSAIYEYHKILYSFDFLFTFTYITNFIQIILNAINCLPLAFYILRIRLLPTKTWQVLLVMRLIFDVMGHRYELITLKSVYYADPLICFYISLQSMAIYWPSYFACYRYSFKQEVLSSQK